MNGKIFSFGGFLGFRRSFCGIERPSEILVLLVNLGNGILINLILSFSNSLISQHYFLQLCKSFVLNKMGYFVYNGLGDWM